MGQKVNPILFRLGSPYTPKQSTWYSNSGPYSHLLSQDLELRSFLSNILKTRGILLRLCRIVRSPDCLIIHLDLYFSYLLAKQAKFFWARSLFKTIKKKYTRINRIKDVKNFVFTIGAGESLTNNATNIGKKKYIISIKNRKKIFLSKLKKGDAKKKISFFYKNRLFYFLIFKKHKKLGIKKKGDLKVLSVLKNSNRIDPLSFRIIRLNFQKFNRLFLLKKFKYNFRSYYLKKTFLPNIIQSKKNTLYLLELNRNLCKSVQSFSGIEEVKLNLYSNQLNYLPSFQIFQKNVFRELVRFQKNRDLNKYFVETIENLYFVIKTFGFGNAYLLSTMLIFLLENVRKQIFIAKFLKKSMQVLFQSLPRNEISVDGIKILIKGRFNKRRRTKKIILQEGQISLQTISTPIDYYQTQAVTIYGTFGIKVWISRRQ